MVYHIIGYRWCHFFQAACSDFVQANIPFVKHVVIEKSDLLSEISNLCENVTFTGSNGTTSPQIFRKMNGAIFCVGGYDDLCSIGIENLSSCPESLSF